MRGKVIFPARGRALPAWALAGALLGAGCADITVIGSDTQGSPGITQTNFAGLDAGAKNQASLHFNTQAYRTDEAQAVSGLAERQYTRIMNDTGLMSFMPPGLYPLVVYGSREEFLRKTGMPSWSAGVTVGNAIYTFDSPELPTVLAHEMSHLVFNEYMGRPRDDLRWLNEGLAVYEEQEAFAAATGRPAAAWAGSAAANFHIIPFDQMVNATFTEENRSVSAWYNQVGSVVRFMIERGGVGFSQLLAGLRDGRHSDDVMKTAFPGLWDSFRSLEAAWRG